MGSREQGYYHEQPGSFRGALDAVLFQVPHGSHYAWSPRKGHKRKSKEKSNLILKQQNKEVLG